MNEAHKQINAVEPELVSSSNATSIAQSQAIVPARDQVECLCYELAITHQTIQRQQILIETLALQLESSQERVAQLEREFTHTQQCYNEQSYQLVQSENACRELRHRLSRQQSYTLQFKAALEKCLELSLSKNDAEFSSVAAILSSTGLLSEVITAPELSPLLASQRQPIPSWSAQKPLDLSSEESDERDSTDLFSLKIFPLTVEQSLHVLVSDSAATTHVAESNSPELEISEVEQTKSQSASNPIDLRVEESATSSVEEPVRLEQANSSEVFRETASLFLNQNWPSPVVYPSRPPKGRKSLAAVELPTFSLFQRFDKNSEAAHDFQ